MKSKININKFEKDYNDKNKNGIIEIGLDKLDDIYSPYSLQSNKKINYDVYTYIKDISDCIPTTIKSIDINVYLEDNTTDAEKIEAEATYRKYIAEEVIEKKLYIKKIFFLGSLLLLIGITLMICNSLFHLKIINSLLEIATWAFVWKTIDIFFFHGILEINKYTRIKRLFNCEFNFKKYSSENKIKK